MSKCILFDIPVHPDPDNYIISSEEKELRTILTKISISKGDYFWKRKNKKSYSRGILSIASALKSYGHEVFYLTSADVNDKEFEVTIKQCSLCGISSATPFINYVYKLTRLIKLINPKIKIVLGGYHGTALPEKVLRECLEIDVIIRGSGERSMVHLANSGSETELSNSCYRKDDSIIVGSIAQLDPDYLFPPDYSILHDPLTNYRINLQTTIGCNHNCSFCGNIFRRLSKIPIELLKKEWDQFKNIGSIQQIHFCDTDFLSDVNHAIIICNLLPQYFSKDTKFTCDIRGDSIIDIEILKLMERVGFNRICIGFETANNNILKANNKDLSFEDNLNAAKTIKSCTNISVYAYWIIGLPFQTLEDVKIDIEKAANLIEKGLIDEISTTVSFIPLPGSDAFMDLKKFKTILNSNKWSDYYKPFNNHLYRTPNISSKQFQDLFTIYLKRMISAYKLRYNSIIKNGK